MQCGDLEWFYCKDGEILNANEAMEKRLIIYKKIGRELKSAHNLAKKLGNMKTLLVQIKVAQRDARPVDWMNLFIINVKEVLLLLK
ncbi:hypothetical protein ABN102_15400 [Proteus vulgaris]|uniref:hypothetical protein n=1 Tax=Proteus vulgaris TaxID=585 RepID=UPI0032DAE50C